MCVCSNYSLNQLGQLKPNGKESASDIENEAYTAITLTPPTVGQLSADDRPIYRPIRCQILALFSSADKNKIITTLLSIGRQFLGLAICR